jgi:hypothetical protein
MKQRNVKTTKTEAEIKAEEKVFWWMVGHLRDFGYEPAGRCLELGDEMAFRYENGRHAVNIVFGGDGPMHYVQRRDIGLNEPDPERTYEGPENPLSLIGQQGESFDDKTMSDTEFSVGLPSVLRIPGAAIDLPVPDVLKDRWYREIEQAAEDDTHRYMMGRHADLISD